MILAARFPDSAWIGQRSLTRVAPSCRLSSTSARGCPTIKEILVSFPLLQRCVLALLLSPGADCFRAGRNRYFLCNRRTSQSSFGMHPFVLDCAQVLTYSGRRPFSESLPRLPTLTTTPTPLCSTPELDGRVPAPSFSLKHTRCRSSRASWTRRRLRTWPPSLHSRRCRSLSSCAYVPARFDQSTLMRESSHPRRSRTLLRAVLGHFKDLQDEAVTDAARVELKQGFALAIYVRPCPPSLRTLLTLYPVG